MPALSFSGTTSMGPFWAQILIRRKVHTCRLPRKRPIKEGDRLVLYWKQRLPKDKKLVHKIGYAQCIGVRRVFYGQFAYDDDFARKDGFRNHLELQEWFGDPYENADVNYDVISFKLIDILPDDLDNASLILANTHPVGKALEETWKKTIIITLKSNM